MKIGRRGFLKYSGGGLAGISLASPLAYAACGVSSQATMIRCCLLAMKSP